MSIIKDKIHPENEPQNVIYPETSVDQVKGIDEIINELNEQINELLLLKQNKQDNNLQTENKTIVGAINEINNKSSDVSSVNGKVGDVILNAEDIKLTTNQQTVQNNFIRVDNELNRIEEKITIINQDLSAQSFTPITNTYYRHTGTTTTSFIHHIIYFYDGTKYNVINGSSLNLNIENGSGEDSLIQKYSGEVDSLHFANTNTGESATVLGESNDNTANRALVNGKLLKNASANSIISGFGNGRGDGTNPDKEIITGNCVIIGGSKNENINAENSIVSGLNNRNNGRESIVCGSYNRNYYANSIVAGAGLVNNAQFGAKFGRYNAHESANPNIIFAVGNGSDDAHRNSAIEVWNDGRTKVFGTPTENEDVIRINELKYKKINLIYDPIHTGIYMTPTNFNCGNYEFILKINNKYTIYGCEISTSPGIYNSTVFTGRIYISSTHEMHDVIVTHENSGQIIITSSAFTDNTDYLELYYRNIYL